MRPLRSICMITAIVCFTPQLPCWAETKTDASRYWDQAWTKARGWQKDAALASASAVVRGDGKMATDGSSGMPLAMMFASKSAGQQLYITINPTDGKLSAMPMSAAGQMNVLAKEPRSLDEALDESRKAGISGDTLVSASLIPDGSGGYQWMLMATQTAKVLYVGPTGGATTEVGGAGAAVVAEKSQGAPAQAGADQIHLKSTVATESAWDHQDGAGAISPDLSLAICNNAVINTATGKTLRRVGPEQFSATAVALSPDARLLAVAGWTPSPYEISILVVDLARGKERTLFSEKPQPLQPGGDPFRDKFHALAFSPDGKVLASVRGDNGVRLWSVKDEKPKADLPDLKNQNPMEMAIARFSPDGKTLLAAARQQDDIARWDVSAGKALDPIHIPDLGVEDFAFVPDDKTVAAVGNGGAFIFDLGTGKASPLPGMIGLAHTLAVSPDGKTLAAYFNAQALVLWDLSTHRVWQETRDANSCELMGFSSDGTMLATLADTIQRWDVSGRPGAKQTTPSAGPSAASQVKAEAPAKHRRMR